MNTKALLLFLVVPFVGACQNAAERTPAHMLLWVPSNATSVMAPTSFKDGSAAVQVKAQNVDPDLLTRQLADHYSGSRWDLRTSVDQGWVIFPGGGIIPEDAQGRRIQLQTKYWRAEWEDEHGNVIKYTLKQSRILDSPDSTIDVYGEYLPASLRSLG